jgi:putative oxidoreductase
MSDLRLTNDRETMAEAEAMPRAFDIAWLPRIGVAMFFILVVGLDKMSTNPRGPWVKTFDTIGLGQWLRYVTGALQISGGLLFLFTPTMTIGALLLGGTMVGAAVAQIFFLHSPASASIPLGLLVLILIVRFKAARRRP